MAPALRKVAIGAAGVLVVALLAAIGLGAWLALPGRPSAAKSLAFDGFVELPEGHGVGPVRIMDYLTVSGRTLYAADETSGNVFKVSLDGGLTDAAAALVGPPAAHGAAIDPQSGLAFVSRSAANTVDVYDPAALQLVKRIPVAEDADGIFYDPVHKLIYVVHGDPKAATLIDPQSRTKVGEIPLGGKPEFAVVDPVTRLLYQNLEDVNAVAAVDLGARRVVGRWPLVGCDGPTGLALDEAHRRLFAVCSANAKLVVFDLERHLVTATLPIGDGPDAVAYDPGLGRIYATGKSGVMSVTQQVDPDQYRPLDMVRLHYGAHTLTVDPKTHRVFVAYAALLVSPRLAVFTPRP
jgi:DNA-binding beta-propeller fold protein YncE